MPTPHSEQAPCLYCGKLYPIGADRCPHCQAPTHVRPQDRTRRFRWLLVILILASLFFMLWLPR